MSIILLEVAVILMLLLLNGVFAMSEMAIVAARRTRLEHRAEQGDAGARAALVLAANPTNFLSTVQVGITLVGVLAGAFGGAGIAARLAARLATVPALAAYADALALGLVVAAITYLSLIIGELVPKQIALGNPERIAALVARPMGALSRVGGPLVRVLTGSTNLVFRMLGIRATVDPGVTEQDIRATVEQGAEAGVVEEGEHDIIENAFRLGDRRVASLMTPRLDLHWLDVDAAAADLLALDVPAGAPPLLVCEGEVDRVLGLAPPEALLRRALAGDPFDLRAVLRTPLFVPGSMRALDLLETFRRSREHVALVLDEFGGVQGMATSDDILEALVGELPEPGDPDELEIARQPDGSWLVDGGVAVEDLEAELDLDPLPPVWRREARTVGGLVMAHLGRLPVEGDGVEVAGLRLEVTAMDGRRVERLRVRTTPRTHRAS